MDVYSCVNINLSHSYTGITNILMQMYKIGAEQKERLIEVKSKSSVRGGSGFARCLFNCSLITGNSYINAPIIVSYIYIDHINADRS